MLSYVSIGINLLLILATLFVIFVLLLPVTLGAPYLPIDKDKLLIMIKLANIRPGERAVDLGSGDGRVVIALAQAGAEAHGYEINPLLVWLSRRKIRRAGLKNRAFIHCQSFRRLDFSAFQIVTIYGLKSIMRELEGKLQRDLPRNGRVISCLFQFPHWRPDISEKGIRRYHPSALL